MPPPTVITARPLPPPQPPARSGIIDAFQNAFSAIRRIFPGGPPIGEYGAETSMPVLSPFQAQPVPEPDPTTRPRQTTAALGGTGVPIYAGFVTDLGEYNGKLQGSSAFPTYEKMRRSDPDVRAGLLATKLPIRCAQYQVVPGVTAASPLHGLATEIADFVSENLFGGLESMSSTGFYHGQSFESILENALLNLDFGCSCHELLWHIDGSKVKLRRMAPRLPMTFYRFYPDTDGETLLAMEQYGYRGDEYINSIIPAEKIDYFTFDKEGADFYGRALALRTPIPTPEGLRALNDLKVGDQIFNEQGIPCNITAKSRIWKNRPCYRVKFSDGSSLVADANHLWSVWSQTDRTAYDRRRRRLHIDRLFPKNWWSWKSEEDQLYGSKKVEEGDRGKLPWSKKRYQAVKPVEIVPRTTKELSLHVKDQGFCNYVIPNSLPLQIPSAELPIDPYVLGQLLGDGSSNGSGKISCHPDDREEVMQEFTRLGYEVNASINPDKFFVHGLRKKWIALGLMDNKHVPDIYLYSSVAQRTALLQGLIDSDGTVHPHGSFSFANTNKRLVDAVYWLASSLGITAIITPRKPTLRAGKYGLPAWSVSLPSSVPLARLQRKAAAARLRWKREQTSRYIRSIEPVEPQDTVCIEVDSPSHLFLAGEACVPTHNSALRYCYAPWFIKSNLYRLDSIAIERNGMGIPVMQMAENADDDDKSYAQRFVTMVATHEQTGLTIPFGYDFKLVGMTGRIRDPKTSIQHHSEQILRSFLAQFLAFGTTATGSRSLSQDMSTFFKLGLNTIARGITNTITQSSIRRLVDFNYGDSRKGPLPYPRLVHSNIAALDPMELADKIKNLAQWQVDIIQPDDELEAWFRKEYGISPKSDMRVRWMPVQTRVMEQPAPGLTPKEIESGKDPGGPQPVVEPLNPAKGVNPPQPGTPAKTPYTPGVETNPKREAPAKMNPVSQGPATSKMDDRVTVLNLLVDTQKISKLEKIVDWDFDGTVSVYDSPDQTTFVPGKFGKVSPNAKALMEKLAAAGFTNTITTARKDIVDVEAWVKKQGLPVSKVSNTRGPALAHIDDRGLHIDWKTEYDPDASAVVLKALKKIAKQHGE